MPDKRETVVNVGIDVGKTELDVVIHERGLHFSTANDAAGVRYIIGRLSRYAVERIVVEATGRREYNFVLAAAEKACRSSSANPSGSGAMQVLPAYWPKRIRSMPGCWPNMPP